MAIARISDTDESNIWRFNPATGELRQITSGRMNYYPSCTRDGNWLIYDSFREPNEIAQILKIPTGGGVPVQLAGGPVFLSSHAVSPDGQKFVYLRYEGEGKQRKILLVVQKLEADSPDLRIETASSHVSNVGWTPDGAALSFIREEDDGTSSLWMQRLSGGSPEQLMHFDSEPSRIIVYAWSQDGRKIAVTREDRYATDVVQFTGFR